MHEREPQPDSQSDGAPWDPGEQVGDIYEVEIFDAGGVAKAEHPSGGTDPEATDTAEAASQVRPSIWIGSWLDYNNGILHGDWIAADRPDDDIWADGWAVLAASPTAQQSGTPAEDWGIFDTDGFGRLRIGEQESIAWIGAVARGIAEHGLAYAAYADVVQDEPALAGFEDDYLGEFENLEAYAEQLVADLGYDGLLDRVLPDALRPYCAIDVASLARDMQLGGDIHVVPTGSGRVWVFTAR